jgi:hypothetical protein
MEARAKERERERERNVWRDAFTTRLIFFTPGRAGLQLTAAAIYVVLSGDRLSTDVNHVFRA